MRSTPLLLSAAALGLLAAPASAPAAARDCGTVVSKDVRFPVHVTSGEVPCADAVAALGAFLDDAAAPAGWTCARGHSGQTFAARCARGEDEVEAVNPPRVDATDRARRGARVTAVASGLKRGRYTLSLVADEQPARGVRCLARVGRAKRTKGGWVTLRGRLPRRLRCYQGLNSFIGTVPAGRGAYHLVVGRKVAPAGWDAERSFVRTPLRVR